MASVMTVRARTVAWVLAVAGAITPSGASAQTGRLWDPFRAGSDLPRTLPAAIPASVLLVEPDLRLGMFWSAGNPGAIAHEVETTRHAFRYVHEAVDGAYRRPLDPLSANTSTASGLSWQPVGTHAAAIGEVMFRQDRQRPSGFGPVVSPYGSNPLVPTDTSTPRSNFTEVRFLGGMGWRLAGWGIGAIVGYSTADNRSQTTPVPRLGRVAGPAATVGAVRDVVGPLRLGVHAGWTYSVETISIIARGDFGLARQLEGYATAEPRPVTPATPYRRRMETESRSLGAELSASTGGTEWVAFGTLDATDAAHWSQQQADPATDRWKAGGHSAGAAIRVAITRAAHITTVIRVMSSRGEATRADLTGVIFEAQESGLVLGTEGQIGSADSPWRGVLRLRATREDRDRRDFLNARSSDIGSWLPQVSAEVARTLPTGTGVAISGSFGVYSAVSRIPNPATLDEAYRELIGPELATYAAQTQVWSVGMTAAQRLGGVDAFASVRHERIVPRTDAQTLPLLPSGDRRRWEIQVGLVYGTERLIP